MLTAVVSHWLVLGCQSALHTETPVSIFDLRHESDGPELARHGDDCTGAETERGDGLQQT